MKFLKLSMQLLILSIISPMLIFSQSVGINSDGSAPDGTAMLDVKSTAKGLLVPRMTAVQRATITSPATGLIVYQTDGTAGFYYNAGTSGSPSWVILLNGTDALPAISGAALTNLNASNLGSGTVPDGRFPATLPAASGVNLTALNATNLGSGTVPDGRFPATLPAASGANLTNLPAANITGTLPAISGVNLTNLNATNLGSGTVPDGRFPATLPAASGTNLTSLNGSNISSGTVPAARLGSGTPDGTKFLRDDNTWQTPSGGSSVTVSSATFSSESIDLTSQPYSVRINRTVTGARAGDVVVVNIVGLPALANPIGTPCINSLSILAWVSSDDTVTIQFHDGGAGWTSASGLTYIIKCIR